MAESLRVSVVLPSSPKRIYEAWLSGEEHSAFTRTESSVSPTLGGKHMAGGGYIEGINVELEPYHRIVQTWRTIDFPIGSADSRLEVLLEEVEGGTMVTLDHTGIPDGQANGYEQGWHKHYFAPMQEYFSSSG